MDFLKFHYVTPQGNTIDSAVEMTPAELAEWDNMMSGYELWSDEQYAEWEAQMAEEQDSDGYGWERRALANLG